MNEHVNPIMGSILGNWVAQQRERGFYYVVLDYLLRKGHHRVEAEIEARDIVELLTSTRSVLEQEQEQLEEAIEKTQGL